jgi:hypothetical protein
MLGRHNREWLGDVLAVAVAILPASVIAALAQSVGHPLAAASGGECFIETVRDQGYLMPRAA